MGRQTLGRRRREKNRSEDDTGLGRVRAGGEGYPGQAQEGRSNGSGLTGKRETGGGTKRREKE